eukprot:CAMPEP_0174250168 /NCGR_PEP_ID=MMETSP0439-20130205/424_1 /TAXON_ID=0 /ORGANISM="Stereomyxa ramosa, Strain Chinc5" /LENGTH=238 /DNA_ID=CAMNT_0015330165 /DNA_START=569 /DNA_END=1285 /DNA_ORIENTATION=+
MIQASLIINNIFEGIFWFVVPAGLVIFNDVAAYACGVTLGKKIIKRKFLSLSPNKTWEGFIGAAVLTMIFTYYFADFLAGFPHMTCPYHLDLTTGAEVVCETSDLFVAKHYEVPDCVSSLVASVTGIAWNTWTVKPAVFHSIFLGLFASFVAPFGGFFASGLKRAYCVKDFDNIFPGHGGMTDRMDCQMIMGVAVHVHLRTFVARAGITAASSIIASFSLLPADERAQVYETLKDLVP